MSKALNINNMLAQYGFDDDELDQIEAADVGGEVHINIPDVDLPAQQELKAPEIPQPKFTQQQPQNIQRPPPQQQPKQQFVQQATTVIPQQPRISQIAQIQLPVQQENFGIQDSHFYKVPTLLNLDLYSFLKYFQLLLLRHRNYQNYIKYMSENFQQEKQQQISQKSQLCQQCDIMRNDIMSGRMSMNLCDFVNGYLLPITYEEIYSMNEIEYKSEQLALIDQFTEQSEQLNQFLSLVSQNIQIGIKKGNKVEKMTSDYIKRQIRLTDEELKYCSSIKAEPIPKIIEEILTIDTSDNKDIPKNTLRLKFKRVLLGPQNVYYLKLHFQDQTLKTEYSNNGILNFTEDFAIDPKIIANQSIEVRVYESYQLFRKAERLVAAITLKGLMWSNSVEDFVPFAMDNYPDCKIEFSLQMREPLLKTLGKSSITIKHISKQYPKIDLSQGIPEYEGNFLPQAIRLFEEKKAFIEIQAKAAVESQYKSMLVGIPAASVYSNEQKQPQIAKEEQQILNQQDLMTQVKDIQQQQFTEPKQQQQLNTNETQQLSLAQEPNQDIIPEVIFIEDKYEEYVPAIIIHGGIDDEFVKANKDKLPEGITLEDALYPENPKIAPVSGFVLKYLEQLKIQVLQLRGKERRSIQDGAMVDFMRIEKALLKIQETGDIDKYISMLGGVQERDQKLIAFYTEIGSRWRHVINYRAKLLQVEME